MCCKPYYAARLDAAHAAGHAAHLDVANRAAHDTLYSTITCVRERFNHNLTSDCPVRETLLAFREIPELLLLLYYPQA